MSISVLILTFNEEVNLLKSLSSVRWCDDVVVLDSKSSDRSQQIARENGARVFEREFDNYANQRNFALEKISYRYPWLLMLDADEAVPVDLQDEMRAAVAAAPDNTSMFLMRRRDHLFGRWIKRSSGYPTWFGRLMKLGRVRVERAINEEYVTTGSRDHLRAHLDHFPFNKGISEWIRKHDKYSSMEASLLVASNELLRLSDLLSSNPLVRRKAQKQLVFRLPCRPLFMFFALYFVRGGWLEGRAGFTFCSLRAWYEYMIDCKRIEIERRENGLSI